LLIATSPLPVVNARSIDFAAGSPAKVVDSCPTSNLTAK
jgi:hypothetical protein